MWRDWISPTEIQTISENLRATPYRNIQVMENHQPIRVLQRKIKTEDVALNLKLRPEFRDRWLINAEGGPAHPSFLWKGADALQISRSSQSAYLYKGIILAGCIGEQNTLTESPESRLSGAQGSPISATFLIFRPYKERALLFNHTAHPQIAYIN